MLLEGNRLVRSIKPNKTAFVAISPHDAQKRTTDVRKLLKNAICRQWLSREVQTLD
jgi:hypothetical protein